MKDIGIQLIDHTDDGEVLDLKIKIRKDASGKIVRGLVVGNTLQQNIGLLMIAQQGEFKAEPRLGIGLSDLTLGTEMLELRHKIRLQFPVDGLRIKKLDFYPNRPVQIEAYYEG